MCCHFIGQYNKESSINGWAMAVLSGQMNNRPDDYLEGGEGVVYNGER